MINNKIKNLDIYFSADCNLNCKYCYIYKNKNILQNYNNLLRNSLENDKFFNNIKEKTINIKDNIESIGLWGAEPTLNSFYCKKFFNNMFNWFENLNKVFFSTNCIVGFFGIKPIIEIIEEYNRIYNRKISLEIQFSIDGPEWITDNNRGIGTTKAVLKTIDDTILYCYNNLKLTKISTKVKPTLDGEIISKMKNDKEKIIEWYCLFDNLQEKYKKYKKDNLKINLLGYPTIVNPDKYTVQNGKDFSEFVENIMNLDESYFKNYKHPLILQTVSCYEKDRIESYLDNIPGYGACSAGAFSLSIDMDGNLHSCHRFFTEIPCPQDGLETISSYYKNQSKKDIFKMDMLNYNYHNNLYSRYEFFSIIAKSLAKYGQIEKIYLTDEEELFNLFLSIQSVMCHFGQGEETKDVLIAQTGYIKLLGNGAHQKLIKYISEGRLK